MRFRTGFVVGCAAGYWAASKASQLQRQGVGPRSGEAAARGETVSAEKVRAISDLARARLGDLLESPIGGMAKGRVTELIGSSLSGNRPADPAGRWPR